MDEDTASMWRDMHTRAKERKRVNRQFAVKIMTERGVKFKDFNGGSHLLVEGHVDYWPGTGLWQIRETNKRGRGVWPLIKYLSTL